MKRKWLLITIFIAVFSNINYVHAEEKGTCYYMSDKAMVRVSSNGSNEEVYVDSAGGSMAPIGGRLKNVDGQGSVWYLGDNRIPAIYPNNRNGFKNDVKNGICPQYITLVAMEQRFLGIDWWFFDADNIMDIFFFNSEAEANDFLNNKIVKSDTGMFSSWGFTQTYIIKGIYKAKLTDASTYWGQYTGDDYQLMPNTDPLTCEELLDPELKTLISDILGYVAILVPIIIIGFGMYEFTKGMASGEDEMKKAQKRFVLRIIAGIGVFLVPVFVNIIFSIAESIWQGTGLSTCMITGEQMGDYSYTGTSSSDNHDGTGRDFE